MAFDTTITKYVYDGPKWVIITVATLNDTLTDEVIIDASELAGMGHGLITDRVSIEEIWYDIQGYFSVMIEFDATTDDLALRLSEGSGLIEWKKEGGLHNPRSTGYTGDITVTTPTTQATDSLTIRLVGKKKHA